MRREHSPNLALSFGALALLISAVPGAAAQADLTFRVSVDTAEVQADAASGQCSTSSDGRWVAFVTEASLNPFDQNGLADIYLRDLKNGVTRLVSKSPDGVAGNSTSDAPDVSADGSHVAFASRSTNLTNDGLANPYSNIYVYDVQTERITLATLDHNGKEESWDSYAPSISGNGRFVAFESWADDLIPNDNNHYVDVFRHDLLLSTTVRVSWTHDGDDPDQDCVNASISWDGAWVAFDSEAHNLVAGDSNDAADVFLRHVPSSTTTRASQSASGGQASGASRRPSISGDGRSVAFESDAEDLVGSDSNGVQDVFVKDLVGGAVQRASVDSQGSQATGPSRCASLSGYGKRVAFLSAAIDLVAGDANDAEDAFLRDLQTGKTWRRSLSFGGAEAQGASTDLDLSSDGRALAFVCEATNLVSGDTNRVADVFLRTEPITLDVNARTFYPLDLIRLDLWQGPARGLALIRIVEVNGVPVNLIRRIGRYDRDGIFSYGGTVPDGLGGIFVTFECIGFTLTDEIALSNRVEVYFEKQ